MPSDLLLDPDEYLAPIPGDDPAGRKLTPMELIKLKEYQEDFDPDRDLTPDMRDDPQYADAKRVTPKWDAIIDFGKKFLQTTGKDLELVVRMVEALTKTRGGGFAGLKTGVRLMRRLSEECWDRMHPAIDPDDPESIEDRTGKFNWLDDPEKKPYFPTSVRAIPVLTASDGRVISFLAYSQQGNRPPDVSPEEFRQAVSTARAEDVERVRVMDEDITEALNEFRELIGVLDAKAGGSAPGFGAVRKALVDCQTVTQHVIKLRGTGGDQPPPGGEGGPGGGLVGTNGPAGRTMPGVPVGGGNPLQVRDQIYAQLEQLVGMLEEYDPHSPVTFLIRRALELREKKFPDLVDALTRDARVLDFLRNPVG